MAALSRRLVTSRSIVSSPGVNCGSAPRRPRAGSRLAASREGSAWQFADLFEEGELGRAGHILGAECIAHQRFCPEGVERFATLPLQQHDRPVGPFLDL